MSLSICGLLPPSLSRAKAHILTMPRTLCKEAAARQGRMSGSRRHMCHVESRSIAQFSAGNIEWCVPGYVEYTPICRRLILNSYDIEKYVPGDILDGQM